MRKWRGLSWYRREIRPCLRLAAGSTEDALVSLRFPIDGLDKGQGSIHMVGGSKAAQRRSFAMKNWEGIGLAKKFFQIFLNELFSQPDKKDEDQRNRTEVDKTSLFLLRVLCCSSHRPPDIWWHTQQKQEKRVQAKAYMWKTLLIQLLLCSVLLEPPLQPGHCSLFIPFLGPWLERMRSWADFVICAWVTCKLHDTASRIPWCWVQPSDGGFGASRETHFLPPFLCSQIITIRYNVKLVFTVEMWECPHGKFLPSSFHGGKKGSDSLHRQYILRLSRHISSQHLYYM